MKKLETVFILLCALLVLPDNCIGRTFEVKFDTLYVDTYDPELHKEDHIFMKVPYGGAKIYNPGEYWKVRNIFIERVVLVTALFPHEEGWKELNKKRLAALNHLAPELFENPQIQWTLVIQEEFDNSGQVYNLWHGFALQIRWHEPAVDGGSAERLARIVKGESELKDSSLIKILDRNKHLWNNSVIVSDLTGSMSPYISQLLVWLRLNESEGTFTHLLFFNDGDDKMTSEKEIGSTGGLYSTPNLGWEHNLDVALESLDGGYGGDGPENDIEALLRGIDDCPSCTDVILVADNFSAVRDLELMRSLDKPIHVVLCGSYLSTGSFVANTEYLDLARKTGGTVHTIEEDIERFMAMKEGDEIEIDGAIYVIKGGKFVSVTRG